MDSYMPEMVLSSKSLNSLCYATDNDKAVIGQLALDDNSVIVARTYTQWLSGNCQHIVNEVVPLTPGSFSTQY
jgi:hypothetical protein